MKKMSRILALALVLALAFCLCACGGTRGLNAESFEVRLKNAEEKMSKLDSVHTDANMEVSMEMSFMGQSESVDMTMSYAMDVNNKTGVTKMEADVSALGTSQKVLYYAENVNGEATVYMSMDNGRSWQKQTAQTDIPISTDSTQAIDLFVQNANSFTKTGTETINGSAATVYSGVLSGKYVEDVMHMTGMDSTLGDTLGVAGAEDMFSGLGDIPMTVAIDDESGMVVRYTMDMTDVMQGLMKNIFDMAMQANGMDGIEIKVEISKALCTMTMSRFNAVGEIVIPDAAKAA